MFGVIIAAVFVIPAVIIGTAVYDGYIENKLQERRIRQLEDEGYEIFYIVS